MVLDADKAQNNQSWQLYVFASKQEQNTLLSIVCTWWILEAKKLLTLSIRAYNIIYYNLKLSVEDYISGVTVSVLAAL